MSVLSNDLQARIQSDLRAAGVDGWLTLDFRGMNPIFSDIVGRSGGGRRTMFFIPATGDPELLVHAVDSHRFVSQQHQTYANKDGLLEWMSRLNAPKKRIVMEYSPGGNLPTISYLDAGMMELLRSMGFAIESSANVYQSSYGRWTSDDLTNHKYAAAELSRILLEAYKYIGANLGQITDEDVLRFIDDGLNESGLEIDSPNISTNDNTCLSHFEPGQGGVVISSGDWILIDVNARVPGSAFADITWLGYAGSRLPTEYEDQFNAVKEARDRTLNYLQKSCAEGRTVQGWEMDRIARDFLDSRGYGKYFTHRLGHSLGRQSHGRGANLDDYESHDTRPLIPDCAFTIEPGIYGPRIGTRVEVDVYMHENDFEITTPVQQEVELLE